MLKIRAGWVVSVGLCLLMATAGVAADDYSAFLGTNWDIQKTQEAEINGFNHSSGVVNINSAAGNLNNQTAFTTIAIGNMASGFAADDPFFQGYAGTFVVGNTVFGQGVFSQEIYPGNNRVVVRQRTVGFLVDARYTAAQVAISRSFQGYQGVATVNQAAGNLNNQATMAVVNFGPGQKLASVHAGRPLRVYSSIRHNILLDCGSSYKAVIAGGSFQNYSGMLAVSQTAGNLNNTANYVGLSLNAAPEILSKEHLGNVTAGNKKDNNVIKGTGEYKAEIEPGAFCNFNGVASVTQVAGSMNQVVTQVGVNVVR